MPRIPLAALALALFAAVAFGGAKLFTAASVGTGYAAKVICSLVHNTGQDPDHVLGVYVAREVAPLGAVLRVRASEGGVEARSLPGIVARAVHRPGLGCTLLPGASEAALALPEGLAEPRPGVDPRAPWPAGGASPAAPVPPAVASALDRAFREPELAAGRDRVRQTTAVVVAHDGRLVAERYAAGYGPETPMLSWSMAKSVLAALVGVMVGEGRVALEEPARVPEWQDPDDPRRAITLDQLMRMSSGLAFEETIGPTSELPRMLFTFPDVGAFAARSRLAAQPDSVWSYSSGTSNLVARIVRDAHGGDLAAMVRYARERLFDPAAMTSAFFEPDAAGTFIGSSFVFASARDWARFGELHRRGGTIGDRRVLPESFVRYVTTPTPAAPEGRYGAHWWLNAGDPDDPTRRMWPSVPRDAYSARGHSGQYVVVVPSARLVVVRLGLSFPDDGDDGAETLVADLVSHFGTENP